MTKRRKTYKDPNQYRQMEVLTAKWGKRARQGTFLNKLVQSSYNYVKYICRAYNIDNNGGTLDGGLRQPLGLEQGATNVLPVFVINLTSIPQGNNPGGASGRYQQNCWRLTQAPSSGVIGWQNIQTMNLAGSYGNFGWVASKAEGTAAAANLPTVRRALMEWLNIRFRIRGPTSRPTRVTAMIVQPYAWFRGLPEEYALTNGSIVNEQHTPWIQMAGRNTYNIVQNIPSGASKAPWKVLRSQVFEIQPTSSTENDANGHDVVQKWFWKCNKMAGYDYQGYGNPDDPDATNANLGDGTTPYSNTVNDVELGKRVYLIFQAYAPNASATFDPSLHPSIEWSIEKKLSSLNGIVLA